jgi:protoporphyrinogen oxidase
VPELLSSPSWILGAGVTGLAASWISGRAAFEAESHPGGLCRSYYLRPGDTEPLQAAPGDTAYRFEVGGGHWIFGGDPQLNSILSGFCRWRHYQRRSAVFFPDTGLTVPYPLQYNLRFLDPGVARRAVNEMRSAAPQPGGTLAGWLLHSFGPTLNELFFRPFHDLYTAGMSGEIAPQDSYKTPIDLRLVEQGLTASTDAAGYNNTFLYPEGGLSVFCANLAVRGDIRCNRRVADINLLDRQILFSDGDSLHFGTLVSTLPLHRMVELTGLRTESPQDPSTAVLVLNIGGIRGPQCPDSHWLYVPRSRSGFHRIGFYGNVDADFLPRGRSECQGYYVERAFRSGQPPGREEVAAYSRRVVAELREWGFLSEAETLHATWVGTAYTWTRPASRWRDSAIDRLAQSGIHMAGRYGRWRFQGIADSFREGLLAGVQLRASSAAGAAAP